MTTQKHNQMMSFNRLLILALTAVGLAMDGVQCSDPVFLAASFLWLWMPDCVRIEAQWLQRCHLNKRRLNDAATDIHATRQST